MNYTKFFRAPKMVFVGILIVIIAILVLGLSGIKSEKVRVLTQKKEYGVGSNLKLKINNHLNERICFSSCYPYSLSKKVEGGEKPEWKNYSYAKCDEANIAGYCVDPNGVKAFELALSNVEKGTHRIEIPACIGCSLNDSFRENQRLYSNEFIIE